MNVLVTGGMGYIGSHTVVQLLEAGHDVVVIDNLSNSDLSIASEITRITHREFSFVNGDIRDEAVISKLFDNYNFDSVIHFAGLKSVSESISNPFGYYDNNISGTLILIGEVIKKKIRNFIFSSSATVYGVPERIPLDEDCRVGGTTNPYGTSKFFAEQILKDIAFSVPDLDVTILRYFNPIGAHPSGYIGEKPNGIPNNLVPYITQVAAGKLDKLSIFGGDYPTPDGTGVRDFIHVMDLADGHLAALCKKNEDKSKNFHVYNLGTGNGCSVLNLVEIFEKVNGLKINYEICNKRQGDIPICWSDPSKARKELNWIATRSIEDMLKDSWNWERNNCK